jgi:hypothetical protein
MTPQIIRLETQANAVQRELAETDLEQIAAGKDGDYGWIGIYSGRKAVEVARRHPSPEIDHHGHIV